MEQIKAVGCAAPASNPDSVSMASGQAHSHSSAVTKFGIGTFSGTAQNRSASPLRRNRL